MKTVWKIFVRDVQRLSHNVIAIIVIIGMAVIPALYAWFNIAANWDPYGSTSGIKVAVVNQDTGYHMVEMGPVKLEVGQEIINNLRENEQIGWTFTDYNTAMSGVRAGEYYAAVVIPEDFSQKIASFLSDDIANPQIDYYVNEKKNAIAPKITDNGISVIQQQVNSTFISVATETIASILNLSAEQLDELGASPLDNLLGALRNTHEELSVLAASLAALDNTVDAAVGLTHAVDGVLPLLQDTLTSGAATTTSLQQLLLSSGDAAGQISDAIALALESCAALNDAVGGQLADAADKLGSSAESAALQLETIAELAGVVYPQLSSQLTAVLDGVVQGLPPSSPEQQAVLALIDALTNLDASQQQLAAAASETAESTRQLGEVPQEMVNTLEGQRQTISAEVTALRNQFRLNVVPAMKLAFADATTSLFNVSALLLSTADNLGSLHSVLDNTSSTMTAIQTALSTTSQTVERIDGKILHCLEEIDAAAADDKVDMLVELLRNDPELIGNFMASPVDVNTTVLYPIANYGSAMTPFYTTLALWVGGIVLVAIMKTRVEEEIQLRFRPWQAYLGRYLIFSVIGLAQATIICLGDLYFLQVQCMNPLLFLLAGWVSSFVYTMIIYTLTVSFGDIGKALCVILLVIQIAGAGGTFPIEVTPQFFQNLYPFLPFTYGINALRETVAGIYGSAYWLDLLKLLAYVPVALILGLVLRNPLIRLNEFFDDRLKDTKMM